MQVHVAAGLASVLQYAASCGFRYPNAVAKAGTPKTPKSAAQDALFGSVLASSSSAGGADLGTGPAQAASMVEQVLSAFLKSWAARVFLAISKLMSFQDCC